MANSLRQKMLIPYRDKDLLTVDSFIHFCRKNNVSTSRKELEFLDQQSLLIPATIIKHPIKADFKMIEAQFNGSKKYEWRYVHKDSINQFKPRKVQDKIFFHYEGISAVDKDWTEHYETIDPTTKFCTWNNFSCKEHNWTTEIENAQMYSICYSKMQFYTLKLIQPRRQIVIKNKSIFTPLEQWKEKGAKIQEFFKKSESSNYLREELINYYRFFKVLNNILDFHDETPEAINNFFKDSLEDYTNPDESKRESKDMIQNKAIEDTKHFIPTREREDLKKIVESHNFSVENLREWRNKILTFGQLSGIRIPKAYLKEIHEETLIKNEMPYEHAALLNRIIFLISGTRETLNQSIVKTLYPYCPYCREEIKKVTARTKTCGKPKCVQERKNELKRIKRKSGEYS